MKTHKDLDVWKNSMEFAKNIYTLTKNFPVEELYGLTSQMRRAAVSVPSNIAEGAARNSKKEFRHFLYISLGSIAELETHLLLSKKLGFSHNEELLVQLDSIRKMTQGLLKHLETKK